MSSHEEKLEETFEEIAQKAIEEAEAIGCPLADFARGLETMIGSLKMRLQSVREELGG